jgi:MoxR-like ATPase
MPFDGMNDNDRVSIKAGRILCDAFPFIVMTSNGEREFPPAFLRRCLRLDVKYPDEARLTEIVKAHLGPLSTQAEQLIKDFLNLQKKDDLATDQLLNAIYFTTQAKITLGDKETLKKALLRYLTSAEG